jgi:polysaccharide chain length determinant protein (PEP-CTERM system associated)
MHELVDQLVSHLNAIWRYRWYAVVFAWIIALGGWVGVSMIPDRYEATARVYVDTQSVLRPLLSGLAVQPNVDQMVTMMSRTLVSRPNVEKVIQMADMDIASQSAEERGYLVSRLTKELTIKSAGSENLFIISYADKNPQYAKRVVQSLLTLFVERSLGDNRKDSDAARAFIDEQLIGYRDKLVAAESAITDFKRRHMGLMPGGEGSGYFARLTEAKNALRQATLDLREAEHSRDSIKKRFDAEAEIPLSREDRTAGTGVNSETEIEKRIAALEQKLDSLRLSYTEQHPDIVAILPVIEQLKQKRDAEARQRDADAKKTGALPIAAQPRSALYQQLSVSLTEAEAKVAVMTTRVAEYSQRYADLQGLLNAMPQVETEFTQLTRDYEVYKTRYAELLKRRDSAKISGDMEASDAVMPFRVVDPPQVPHLPSAPNRPLLMTVVFFAALAAGVAGAFLISQIRPTIYNERRLREVSGMSVLGTVAMALTDAQKARRAGGLAAFLVSFVSLLSAYAAIMAALMLTVSKV